MYSMFAYSLKLCGFSVGVFDELLAKRHGPFSYHPDTLVIAHEFLRTKSGTWNNPIIDEHPGPPLNHVASGAVVALCLASKNQKNMFSFPVFSQQLSFSISEYEILTTNIQIPRMLRHAGRRLTDSRVGHEIELGSSCIVLEDRMHDPISVFIGSSSLAGG